MKRKKKNFVPGVPTHIYQKGYAGRVLFYCARDRLVYLSIFFAEARARGVKVLAITLMFNHVHGDIIVGSWRELVAFNKEVCRRYAAAFNRAAGRSGPVFMHSFGWSQKRSDKDVMDNLCYLANNPVKKKLCRRGVDNRWTLLAYGARRYPFSEPLALRNASKRMRRAVALAKDCLDRGQVLNYAILDRIFAHLDKRESRQMLDFLIQHMSTVDYGRAASYFGGFQKMLDAFEVTTGSEYDISMDFVPEPDGPYAEMAFIVEREGCELVRKEGCGLVRKERGDWVKKEGCELVRKEGYDLVRKAFLTADADEKMMLARLFRLKTSASERQIRRFLYLEGLGEV